MCVLERGFIGSAIPTLRFKEKKIFFLIGEGGGRRGEEKREGEKREILPRGSQPVGAENPGQAGPPALTSAAQGLPC